MEKLGSGALLITIVFDLKESVTLGSRMSIQKQTTRCLAPRSMVPMVGDSKRLDRFIRREKDSRNVQVACHLPFAMGLPTTAS